jgi:hypothetical protein
MPLSQSPFRRAVAVAATCALAAGVLVASAAPASALIETNNDLSVVGYGDQTAPYIANLPAAIDGHKVLDVAVGNATSFVLRDDNTVYRTWPADSGTREVTGLSNQFIGRTVTDLEASYTGTFALLDDGALVNDTNDGNYGATQGFAGATADQEFSQISAGRHFAIALRTDGTMRSWGQNSVGGDNTPNVALIAAGYNSAMAYTNDGQILAFGSGASSALEDAAEAAIDGNDVLELSSGIGTNFALLDDGTVVSWGNNAAAYTSSVATALGEHDAVAIEARYSELYVTVDDGRVISFEQNPNAPQNINELVTAITDGHRVLQVVGGEAHTLLVLEQPEVTFTAGEAPLAGVVLATTDTVTLTADGFLGGAPYSILWDDVAQTTGTIPSSGVVSQGIAIPDTLAKGIHEVSLNVDGEEFDASVTIGAGFTAGVPTITGTVKVGEELSVARGSWSLGTSFTYSWLRDGKKIAGATDSSYTLTAADVAKTIQVSVKGTKGSTSLTKTSVKTAKVAKGTITPGYVDINGASRVGDTTSVATGDWPEATKFSYQWFAGDKVISKATKSSYVSTASVIDKFLSVKVTASIPGYTSVTVQRSAYFVDRAYINKGSYYAAGTVAVGNTLTAKVYSGSEETPGVTRTYQWQADGVWIVGATKSTFKLTSAQLGKYVQVNVFFAKAGYYPDYTSSYPVEVFAKGAPTGTVKLTGSAKVGSTLTVSVTGAPEDVGVYTYWVKKKGSVVVDLETDAGSYTLQQADKGYQVYAEVYFVKSGFATVLVNSALSKTVV